MCEDTKKAKVSYSDLYAGLFSWNHIFECCFDQVCCRCGNLERVVQKPENSSLSVSFMGWTGKWHDSDIGTSYAGSQRIDIMHYKYASAFFVLYTGLCNAFTIFIPISGERMEFYEDVKFCIISYYGNCIRVSGQSGIAENVFENIIKTNILLCVVMRAQKHLA